MKQLIQLLQALNYTCLSIGIAKASGSPDQLQHLKKLIQNCVATIFIVAVAISAAHGQVLPGTNDPTFNKTDVAFGAGDGFNATVYSVIPQADGKIVVGGEFTSYNGSTQNRIVRLNADGSPDVSFDSGTGFDGFVHAIALQPDGKIVVAGGFSSYNGTLRRSIARLNADGSLDNTFNPSFGFNNNIITLALQPDGKVIVGGTFTSFMSTSRNRIARLNPDGSLDASFNPGQGFSGSVQSMVLQPDGKVVVGGYFSSFNGVSRNRIARLNADGTLDATFTTGTGFAAQNSFIRALALQPDGKIVAGGAIWAYNGTNRRNIARLNADGTLDTSFNSATSSTASIGFNDYVTSITLRPDGKMMVGGEFTAFYGSTSNTKINRIARLNANGSLDTSFNPGTGFSNSDDNIHSIVLLADNKVVIGGTFVSFDGTTRRMIACLNSGGSIDSSFNPATGASNTIFSLVMQPDGKILAGGFFTSYNDFARNHIARLNQDGTTDASFNPGQGFNNTVAAIALQPDGKILTGGVFTSFNGTARSRIARLNANGTLDNTFTIGTGFIDGYSTRVNAIVLQPDGKIIVGGDFRSFNGTSRRNIVRLNADGSLDDSFNPGYGFDGSVRAIALQPDGKIVVGGSFVSGSYSIPRNKLARLNADGSLDDSFHSGVFLQATVLTVALQPDGRILVGGEFSDSYPNRNRLIRLNADGSNDASFVTGTGFNDRVHSVVPQPDGKIIAGGMFTSFNGTDTNMIARLNADGSLDATFDTGTGFSDAVWTIALQPDDKILAGGEFLSYNNIPRKRIARLYGVQDPPVQNPPVQDPPVQDPPVQDPPVQDPPVQDPPVQDPPVQDPPVQDPPVQDPPVQDPPVQDPPVQDPPVQDLPLSTGKDKDSRLNVLLYPNPTSADINLILDGLEATTHTIEAVLYNNLGQPILQQLITPQQARDGIKLPIANFSAGVYHLRVKWGGRVVFKKVVLQK